MLYLNQGYNYFKRKRFHYNEPKFHHTSNMSENEQHRVCCQKTVHYALVKDVIKKYGRSWMSLHIPCTKISGKSVIDDRYISVIEEFVACNGLNQFSIISAIKEVYSGTILENDKTAIHPYELDIYLPEFNLAVEYNSNKYHTLKAIGSMYYHLKKSIRCRKAGIRLIHIYEFENPQIQLSLLQDLIRGIDHYPILDFNKNNLIGCIPKPAIIYNDRHYTIYGAGQLIS